MIYDHGVKNGVIGILRIIGVERGVLVGGGILRERIFGWGGIGGYIYDGIRYGD